jgi:hypothetical protein
MSLKILFALVLCVCAHAANAQASWSYSLRFQLRAPSKARVTLDDFKNGNIQLFCTTNGAKTTATAKETFG